MSVGSVLFAAALAVANSDRLAMADRLFNRGDYVTALTEYQFLHKNSAKEVAPDELLFRMGECERALGHERAAGDWFAKIISEYPASARAHSARLNFALSRDGDERIGALRPLDSDRVQPSIRAQALYRLGDALSDAELLDRSIKLDPKGNFVNYARLRRAAILENSKNAADRRTAITLMLDVAFGSEGAMAEEALYLAGVSSFRSANYSEASKLFRRYLKKYVKGTHAVDVRRFAAWSDYQRGAFTDAAAICEGARVDDLAYLAAACANRTGDAVSARKLALAYLDDFPAGAYRDSAEQLLARLDDAEAEKSGDWKKLTTTSRRVAELTKQGFDRLRLAWALERAGDTEGAFKEYVAVARDFPGTAEAAEAAFRRGCIDLAAQRFAAAELAFREASNGKLNAEKRALALYCRGIAACRIGQENEGVKLLREALRANLPLAQAREARLIIADVDFNSGRQKEALAAYAELVRDGATERMSAAKIQIIGRLLPPAEAKICAKSLIAAQAAEWRQCGYALLGDAEERDDNIAAAVDAFRRCLTEKCVTDSVRPVAAKLGWYLVKTGECDGAETAFRRAVELNPDNAEARAEAYAGLAAVALERGDSRTAESYRTVIKTLFPGSKWIANES